jgi:hypothetical protein
MAIVTREQVLASEKVSQSRLATFYQIGRNAPKPIEPKYDFELGKCFEGVIRAKYDKEYTLPYYPQKNANKRLSDAILNDIDLDTLVRLKKDGTPYSGDEALSDQIELHKSMEAGMFPIDQDDWDMIDDIASATLEMPCLEGITVAEFVERADFDVAIETETDKGILDVISTLEDVDGNPIAVAFDFKLYANQAAFLRMFREKLWIQERHYMRLLKDYCKVKGSVPYPNLVFLAGYKDTKLAQYLPLEDSQENYDRANEKYEILREEYDKWIIDGKPYTGYLKPRFLKVY